jgi:uncharacterized ParB-like nuclease family protein
MFNEARRRALIQDLLAEVAGRPDGLLSFEEVTRQLHLSTPGESTTLQEVPLDKIVGSVGRYRDFNRAFLPRGSVDARRWAHIARLQGKAQLPPIDLFKIGDLYFVRDGNHRVSVARALNYRTIRARVVEIPVRVSLDPRMSPDDLILRAEYAAFLEKTELDRACPEQRIDLTRAGGYHSLLQHIEVHQFYTGLRSRQYPSLPQAAANWYRTVYSPLVERIRESKVLEGFPGRTEADLYLWISENRARLQMRYGRAEAHEAVDDFAEAHRVRPVRRRIRRIIYKLFPRRRRPEPKT